MTVYGLKHPDGRWLYRLEPRRNNGWGSTLLTVEADGAPMTQLKEASYWWITDHEAAEIAAVYRVSPKLTHWELINPERDQSGRYPATLTREEFQTHEDYDQDDILHRLYRAVNEAVPDERHVYEGPYVTLEGREPPGPGEPVWVVDLPHALGDRPEYHHLFPGRINGLKAHLVTVFKRMPYVDYVSDKWDGKPGIHVSFKLPYEEPETHWVRDTTPGGRPRKTGRYVPTTVNRRVQLPISDAVTGSNYAEALAVWNETVTYWTNQVREAAVTACNQCRGTGIVGTGVVIKHPAT